MQHHDSKYFARNPLPPTLGVGVKGQNSIFTEYDHVAYQINRNHECGILQAHILSFHSPSTAEVGSKVKTFFFYLKVVMLHIKLKGMENRAPRKHIFCP